MMRNRQHSKAVDRHDTRKFLNQFLNVFRMNLLILTNNSQLMCTASLINIYSKITYSLKYSCVTHLKLM